MWLSTNQGLSPKVPIIGDSSTAASAETIQNLEDVVSRSRQQINLAVQSTFDSKGDIPSSDPVIAGSPVIAGVSLAFLFPPDFRDLHSRQSVRHISVWNTGHSEFNDISGFVWRLASTACADYTVGAYFSFSFVRTMKPEAPLALARRIV